MSVRRRLMFKMKTGLLQVYTGDGKGKTTAALGLALRAAGAGLRVFIAQFIKRGDYSEIRALQKYLPQIVCRQYGLGRFIQGPPAEADIRAAAVGLAELEQALCGGAYDIVIADEANCAVAAGLFGVEQLLHLADIRPSGVELVITGRGAHPRLLERADLVTEMRAVKHPYDHGVSARAGVEF